MTAARSGSVHAVSSPRKENASRVAELSLSYDVNSR